MPASERKQTCEARQLANTKFLSPYILSSISPSEAGTKDKRILRIQPDTVYGRADRISQGIQ